MKTTNISSPFLLSLALFIGIASPNSHAQSTGPVSVVLSKASISAGEPVLLQIDITNSASQPLELDLGGNGEDNVLISIVDPTGRPHTKPAPAKMGDAPFSVTFFGWTHLEKGQEYSETLILNKWFEFRDVGRYQINIELKSPVKVGKQALPITIPTLLLDVTPYERERLASVCGDLASRIRKRNSAAEFLAAGIAERALGYVRDPIAVQYWDQVLEYADGTAISGLYKIGNIDAVRVLARALDLRDKEIRSQARGALEALARDTSDPAIRAEAELALKHP
jgi:hypothetical protein